MVSAALKPGEHDFYRVQFRIQGLLMTRNNKLGLKHIIHTLLFRCKSFILTKRKQEQILESRFQEQKRQKKLVRVRTCKDGPNPDLCT